MLAEQHTELLCESPGFSPLTRFVTQQSSVDINCASPYPPLSFCFDGFFSGGLMLILKSFFWAQCCHTHAHTHTSPSNRPLKAHLQTPLCQSGPSDAPPDFQTGPERLSFCRRFSPPFSFSVLAFTFSCSLHHSLRALWSDALLLLCCG